MSDGLSDQEFVDIMAMSEYLSNSKIVEDLERLAVRERAFLENHTDEKDEMREIILYNVTILAAASARIKILDNILKAAKESANEPQKSG